MTTGLQGVGSSDLWDAANEYLQVCAAALADTPGGAVLRAYVNTGPPAWDCPDQLTVHCGGPLIADTYPLQPPLQSAHRIAIGIEVNIIILTATVLRCAPLPQQNGNPPTVATCTTASQQSYADVWAIWNHVRQAKRDGTLFAPKEREMALEPALSLSTAGGIQGWQVPIRVQLSGYVPSP